MRTSLLSLILAFFLTSLAFGQQFDKAQKLFFKEDYQQALPLFERIIELEPENAEAYYYAGICHLETYNSPKGLEYLEKAVEIDANIGEEHQQYWLGVAHHFNYKFDEAKRYFEVYKKGLSKEHPMMPTVNKWLKEIELAKKPIEFEDRYWVESLPATINTDHSEHSPVISKDGKTLIFTSRSEGSTGGLAALDGYYYEDIYMVKLDDKGEWGKPEPISDLLNTDHHDASCQLYDNDTKMLLYRWEKDGDLYMTQKVSADSWSEPKRLSKNINSKDFESHGFVTADGKAIYFTSNKGNISGDLDIYVSFKDDKGKWQKAVKLGINSPFDDDAPFVTPDGKTLFFSSRGHNSMGGFDVFRSDWDARRRTWGKPQNLGAPINTPEDDSYLVLEQSGHFGYFSSNRRSGIGRKDIYRFGKVFDLELKGSIINTENFLPIANAKAIFKPKQYNDTQFEAKADDKGSFSVSLPSDWEYDVEILLEDGTSLGELDTKLPIAKEPGADLEKDFEVIFREDPRLPKQRNVRGSVKDLFTLEGLDGRLELKSADSGELLGSINSIGGEFNGVIVVPANHEVVIDFYQDSLVYKNADSFVTSLELGVERSFKVGNGEKVELDSNEIVDTIHTDDKKDKSEEGEFEKKEGDEDKGNDKPRIEDKKDEAPKKEEAKKKFFHSERTVYFAFGKSNLRGPIKKQLDKIVDIVKSDAEITITLTGHTDAISSDAFNLKLSEKRANVVKDYLISQGVDASKIATEFFGESKPVLPNVVDGKDAPLNRQKNRRVEISLDK